MKKKETFTPEYKVNGKTGQITRNMKKYSRNEPCPCKSGKKVKHCHGTYDQNK